MTSPVFSRIGSQNTLGTETRNPDAVIAISDGKPLGEGNGGMFGHGVLGGTEVGEQPGGRGCDEEVATAAFLPEWDEMTGGVNVGEEVDPPHSVPVLVGRSAPIPRKRSRRWRRRGRSVRAAPRPRRRGAALSDSLETSVSNEMPPIADATSLAPAPLRSATATWAPSVANALAMAAPIPLPPPVTTATFPARSIR